LAINEFDPSLELLSVEQVAEFLQISEKTIYSYTCNSGSNGGSKRKRFPKEVYLKLGRKILFVKSKLYSWLENGAKLD
jgi:predicted DNA-binding transcriptional regulator AlpA